MKTNTCLVPLFLLAACSGGSGGGTGEISIAVTDGPIDPALVSSARVDVVKVRVHNSTESSLSSGWITIYDGPSIDMELTDLRNGITLEVAAGRVPAGSYRQVRFHLSGGELTLTNGNVYSTTDGSLDLPSAMTSAGYKIFLDPPVVIPVGGREEVIIDFDLSKSFLPEPANEPESASSYKLLPVMRGAVMSESGGIRVAVLQDDGMGTFVGVPDAMVHVLPPGEVDPTNAVASSITDGTGSAAVLGLLPGTYDVLAEKDGARGRADGVGVAAGKIAVVDVTLP